MTNDSRYRVRIYVSLLVLVVAIANALNHACPFSRPVSAAISACLGLWAGVLIGLLGRRTIRGLLWGALPLLALFAWLAPVIINVEPNPGMEDTWYKVPLAFLRLDLPITALVVVCLVIGYSIPGVCKHLRSRATDDHRTEQP